jgi:hypothetical protein
MCLTGVLTITPLAKEEVTEMTKSKSEKSKVSKAKG